MSITTDPPRIHSQLTRLLHAATALAIVWQLGLSLIMVPPDDAPVLGAPMILHEYGGAITFGILVLFWLNAVTRRTGTRLGALLPWGSPARLAALWADLKAHLGALLHLRAPHHQAETPLASAVHGAGLLLMTAMAASGLLWWQGPASLTETAIELHVLCGNLVWAYLIGHALMGLFNHVRKDTSLGQMWSFGPRKELN
jgi:cytochrome b561